MGRTVLTRFIARFFIIHVSAAHLAPAEAIIDIPERFGETEAERTAVVEGLVEALHQGAAGCHLEIDSHILAENRVQPASLRRERLKQIALLKAHQGAHRLAHGKVSTLNHEVAGALVGREVGQAAAPITPRLSFGERRRAQVGRPNFDGATRWGAQRLKGGNRQGVRFLARGTPGAPEAQRRAGGQPSVQRRQDDLAEGAHMGPVAEELGFVV